jgi:hypothetical protein
MLPDIGISAQMLLDGEPSAQAGAVRKGTFSVGAAKHWELSSDGATEGALLRQVLLDIGSSAQMLQGRRQSPKAGAARHWELSSDADRKRALCSGRFC